MAQERTPDVMKPSVSKAVKKLHRAYTKAMGAATLPLKVFLRSHAEGDFKGTIEAWFHNKVSNPSNPPLRIGRTSRAKSSPSGKKPK